MTNLPKSIRENLKKQEKVLSQRENDKNLKEKLFDRLSLITKREKKDLLVNKDEESFRMKNELSDTIDMNTPKRELFNKHHGNNVW